MQPEVIPLLEDILESAAIIKQYIARCRKLYVSVSDTTIVDGVERRLSIIGEALFKANKYDPSQPITDKSKIVGKQVLVKECDRLEKSRIWLLCHAQLDMLLAELRGLMPSNLPR